MTRKQFITNHLEPMLKALNKEFDHCEYLPKSQWLEVHFKSSCPLLIKVENESNSKIVLLILTYGGF